MEKTDKKGIANIDKYNLLLRKLNCAVSYVHLICVCPISA